MTRSRVSILLCAALLLGGRFAFMRSLGTHHRPVAPSLSEGLALDTHTSRPDFALLDAARSAGFHWVGIDVPTIGHTVDTRVLDAAVSAVSSRKLRPILQCDSSECAEAANRFAHHSFISISNPIDASVLIQTVRRIHERDSRARVVMNLPIDTARERVRSLTALAGDLPFGVVLVPRPGSAAEEGEKVIKDIDTLLNAGTARALEAERPVWVATGFVGDSGATEVVRRVMIDYGSGAAGTIVSLPETMPSGRSSGSQNAGIGLQPIQFMNQKLGGLRLKRMRELPAPMHGAVFTGHGQQINVFWSDAGSASLDLEIPGRSGEGLTVSSLQGRALGRLIGPRAVIHFGPDPVYVEGVLRLAGFGPEPPE